jgi:transcriptional regulator with XRE-family HTH domain
MTITSAQCKAARRLLGWSTKRLADRAGLGRSTVWVFESNVRPLGEWCILVMQRALEDAGIEFTDDKGVELRKDAM